MIRDFIYELYQWHDIIRSGNVTKDTVQTLIQTTLEGDLTRKRRRYEFLLQRFQMMRLDLARSF